MNRLHSIDYSSRQSARSLHYFLGVLLMALACTVGSAQALAQDAHSAPAAATVNINKADASSLAASLNGVGTSRAEAIVRYREEFGPFTTVEQLAEVKGIGASTVEKNRAVITLD